MKYFTNFKKLNCIQKIWERDNNDYSPMSFTIKEVVHQHTVLEDQCKGDFVCNDLVCLGSLCMIGVPLKNNFRKLICLGSRV